jgi:hypothetical protein
MEAARTSETSVNNYFTRQYIPEDNSEIISVHETRHWRPSSQFSTNYALTVYVFEILFQCFSTKYALCYSTKNIEAACSFETLLSSYKSNVIFTPWEPQISHKIVWNTHTRCSE